VIDFGQVRALPTILALGLAAIAMATLAHMSISGVNRRRRELAVFKVLGLTPRGVSAVVAWQATVVTALALVVALPLGVVAGRWAWSVVAARLGAVTEISVPVTVVVALAVLAIVVSNLVAAMPALRAGRIRPGVVIRTE
jgi:ABC-type antimicrobial peptide transport system permease subunit